VASTTLLFRRLLDAPQACLPFASADDDLKLSVKTIERRHRSSFT
jgi:hypothetical protein